ncbi:hypothetical protein FRUB_09883 [Fimbriiglobus ruber]|uniref:Uncharacterized protein n=1 Tax=Fimbriiglobus ruber TaxID=1908690 RepID=A0A225D0C1_9BACT|nr:hypothetical protein FRUB_09883 [Fimbriiglobus ruber]
MRVPRRKRVRNGDGRRVRGKPNRPTGRISLFTVVAGGDNGEKFTPPKPTSRLPTHPFLPERIPCPRSRPAPSTPAMACLAARPFASAVSVPSV